MNLLDRIFTLHRIRHAARHAVSRAALQERLECSLATIGRIIEEMRCCREAPIVSDRREDGCRYEPVFRGEFAPASWKPLPRNDKGEIAKEGARGSGTRMAELERGAPRGADPR